MACVGAAVLALSACGGTASAGRDPAGAAATTVAESERAPVAHGAAEKAAGGSTGTPRCGAAELKPSVAVDQGAAGNVYYDLALTNTGAAACALKGYPGVSLIQRDGSTVGVPAEREGPAGPAVALAPGRAAHVTLHTVNRGVSDAGCWGRHDLLKIYPPGSTDPLTLRDGQVRVCGDMFTVTTTRSAAG
ncbi:DUF4232 domain-containing protein [Streptomyces sp. KL116D]|uniref:DUF4232 domain-containing protein n=1 Tax=Streptomyces sp. KL116D TaxID=3045152 RepID=UPI00355850C4